MTKLTESAIEKFERLGYGYVHTQQRAMKRARKNKILNEKEIVKKATI